MNVNKTEEQNEIIHCKENMIINSNPGAGKTTTSLMLCCENKEKQIFLLTYNSMLKTEVRDKIKNKNFKNCEVHSYHSLVTNYYDNSGYDDEHISKIIKNDNKLSKNIKPIDIFIIDETQDMIKIYFDIVIL